MATECKVKPLSLDEAIAHADEVAGDCCTACKREHKQLADWLRELKSRRSAECANMAKLREALEELVANIEMRSATFGLNVMVDTKAYLDAKAALAAPPRNCDGPATVEDARRAYEEYRSNYIAKASNKFDLPMEFEPWLFALATEKGKTDGN